MGTGSWEMKVSILIHNLNRASILERCLASVTVQTHRPLEVIILDANSTDESPEIIRNAAKTMEETGIEVKSMSCPPMGVAASRNYGTRQASGDILCAIDNDASFVSDEGMARVVDLFRTNPCLAVVSFRVLKGDMGETDPYAWVFRRSEKGWASRQFKTFTFTGGGFCVRADAFRKVGGFWDHLRYSREEEDLGLALLDAGFELIYAPQIAVRHHFDPRGRSSNAQRRYIELKNGILIFWRRMPLPLALLTIIGRIFTMSLRMVAQEKRVPLDLLKAVPEAAREWRQFHLRRVPVTYRAVWKYVSLHFT